MADFDYQLCDPWPEDKPVLIDSSHLPHTVEKFGCFYILFPVFFPPKFCSMSITWKILNQTSNGFQSPAKRNSLTWPKSDLIVINSCVVPFCFVLFCFCPFTVGCWLPIPDIGFHFQDGTFFPKFEPRVKVAQQLATRIDLLQLRSLFEAVNIAVWTSERQRKLNRRFDL